MRLGELLVSEGLLTNQQVEQALRAQVMWGARLGTNMIELGLTDLDTLSRVLGKQHGMPPAYARHFENADPKVQKMVPAKIAEQYGCVPLARLGSERIAVAVTAPLDSWANDIIADNLEVAHDQLVLAIAPELRIRYALERDYNIARPARFLRARKRGNSKLPSFEVDVSFEEDVDIPIDVETPRQKPPPIPPAPLVVTFKQLPEPATKPKPPAPPTAERRRYVRTLADELLPGGKSPPPVPASRATPPPIPRAATPPPVPPAAALAQAGQQIRRAADRDVLGQRIVDAIAHVPGVAAAVLLVPRGDSVTSWTQFRRTGDALPEIAVPTDEPGLVPTVLGQRAVARAPRAKLGPIDALLLDKLGGDELVIAPITIGTQAWCVVALAVAPGATLDGLDAITDAAAAAFARLWRDANR